MNRPLRAGVNAIFLEPGMGGLETYVLELIPALLAADPSLRLSVLCNARGRGLLERQPWASSVELRTPRPSRRGLRALYELGPLGISAGRSFDVLHSPALTAPLLRGRRTSSCSRTRPGSRCRTSAGDRLGPSASGGRWCR